MVETNKLRPDAQVAIAAGASTHSRAGLADGGISGSALTAAHEAVAAFVNGHAMIAAIERKKRYGVQLERMLQEDVRKFREKVCAGIPLRSEVMIFKRKNGIQQVADVRTKTVSQATDDAANFKNGAPETELEYDMDAVRKLAALDDPDLKEETAHAKNVLLTAFLKDDVAAKQGNRAAYEFIRNTVAISAAALSAAATHGTSTALAGVSMAPAAISERIAGGALSAVGAFDVAKGIRGLKQRMRNNKAEVVASIELQKRRAFAEWSSNVGVDPEVKQGIDELGDFRDKVIKSVHQSFLEQARAEAGKERYGTIFPGTMINDRKSTDAKKEVRDLVGKHAYAVIEYQVGLNNPNTQWRLEKKWNEIMQSGGSQQTRRKQFKKMIEADSGMTSAYQLLRDTGMGKGEAVYTLQRMIEMSIESRIVKNPETTTFGGASKFAKDDAMQKATTGRLTSAFSRR
ncbi:hypothetical protein [Burkholderia metallica]|uniref:hypothetical protein n=1 Tax=Burkholderia metallica TaxID=488729 RepID=UPI001CF4B0BC|nr:hypothetical protein [Burkholderia metallica]MCA8003454.1 hypothetical protein [Burkholderia metallica]